MKQISHLKKARCFMVYALAPKGMSAREANHTINAIVADADMPLVLFHDHFIGDIGGMLIVFAETETERLYLDNIPQLVRWDVRLHPLIFSRNPAGFDEQIAYTLREYQNTDWETLRQEQRPTYGNPRHEANTAQEDV